MTLSRRRTAPAAPPAQVGSTVRNRADRPDDVVPVVPRVLRVTAALGWRLLVVVAAGPWIARTISRAAERRAGRVSG